MTAGGPPEDRRWIVFAVASGGALVAFLDITIVSVAFPQIARGFEHASPSLLAWVLSAYNIVFAALLVPLGRLADIMGTKRMFVAGLAGFTVASALCAVAPSAETLIAARVLQAAGAAAIVPTSLAFVLAAFPASQRASATGLWAAAAAVAAAIGPVLGGLLTSAGSWRLVFVINLPIGVVSIIAAIRLLPRGERASLSRPDGAGVAIVIAAAGLATLGVVQADAWGWRDPRIVGAFAAAALLIPALVWRCRHHPAPVIDPALFAERAVSMGNAGTFLFAIGGFGIVLNNVLFLIGRWGYSTLEAGAALTPAPVAMALTAGIGGKLADRFGQRVIAVPGVVLFGLGALWLARSTGGTPSFASEWLPGVVMTGAGCGLAYSAFGSTAVAGLPAHSFGVGSAVNAMFRQLGAALGFALVVSAVDVSASPGGASFHHAWALLGVIAGAAILPALALGSGSRAALTPHPSHRAEPTG